MCVSYPVSIFVGSTNTGAESAFVYHPNFFPLFYPSHPSLQCRILIINPKLYQKLLHTFRVCIQQAFQNSLSLDWDSGANLYQLLIQWLLLQSTIIINVMINTVIFLLSHNWKQLLPAGGGSCNFLVSVVQKHPPCRLSSRQWMMRSSSARQCYRRASLCLFTS